MKALRLVFIAACFFGALTNAQAKPASSITSVEIAAKVAAHYLEYTHFKPIGICVWMHKHPFPHTTMTPELDEYLPDLVVSVFNQTGDNPWIEAREALDIAGHKAGEAALESATGFHMSNGSEGSLKVNNKNDSVVAKTVDVIGSPADLLHIPFLSLAHDTMPFLPYYQSDLDIPGRLGLAEAIRLETYNPFGHYIGKGFTDHWAHEFPREMSIDNNNDYKASLSMALHAADIVTNANTLHVVNSTDDSCGTNCAVANVIEEQRDDHEIWQEVYPLDKHIRMGESDRSSLTPIGKKDEKQGKGNYVFVIWRHYKGCVQDSGHLFLKTVDVPDTIKR